MHLMATSGTTVPVVLPEVTRVFVADALGHILFVKEKGKRRDIYDVGSNGSDWRKLPGWNLPGGTVEGTLEQMREGILYQLRKQGIGTERYEAILRSARKRFPELEHVVMTSIKEVLEETGVLVVPTDISLWERSDIEVVWFVRATPDTYGRRGPNDVHIETREWRPANDIPKGMYKRTRAMVRLALRRRKGVSG